MDVKHHVYLHTCQLWVLDRVDLNLGVRSAALVEEGVELCWGFEAWRSVGVRGGTDSGQQK